MAPNKLADFIKKLDYKKIKPDDEYGDDETTPSNQVQDLGGQVSDDLTFPQLKEAFAAFVSKICIKGFPSRNTPGHGTAYSIVQVLSRLLGNFDDDDKLKKEIGALRLSTWVSLLKAGPNGTHVELMEEMMEGDEVEEYIQGMPKAELGKLLLSLKIDFKFTPEEDYEEDTYASHLKSRMEDFFNKLSVEKIQPVRAEYMQLYSHYFNQLLTLSPGLAEQIGYLVRDMRDNFPDENPYMGLGSADAYKSPIDMVRAALRHPFKSKAELEDHPIEGTLEQLFEAAMKDKKTEAIFDDVVDIMVEFAKTENAAEFGVRIFDTYRLRLFGALKDAKQTITIGMFERCAQMMITIVTDVKLTEAIERMVLEAHSECFMQLKTPKDTQLKTMMRVVNAFLLNGRECIIKAATSTIQGHKKLIKWKDHMDAAKQLLDTVGLISCDKLECDDDGDYYKPMNAYVDFTKELMEQMKKAKALATFQNDLVIFIFRCLRISAPHKADLATVASDSDFLDLAKLDGNAATDILKDCDKALKDPDVKWTRDVNETIVNILSGVIESYEQGEGVSDVQNELFMSIFKTCMEGETLEDKLVDPDHEDHERTVFYDIFRINVLVYLAMHQSNASMDMCADIVPGILKWAKISVQEEHEDLASACFHCLSMIGMCMSPKIAETFEDIMDLFLQGGHVSDLNDALVGLLKNRPSAVIGRLQDIFDMHAELKPDDQYLVMALLMQLSMEHAKEFDQVQIPTLLEMCKGKQPDDQMVILQIFYYISQQCPHNLEPWVSLLMDNTTFKPKTLNLRASIIVHVADRDEELSHEAIDYLMSFVQYSDTALQAIILMQLGHLAKTNVEYMQKHKQVFQSMQEKSTPDTRQLIEQIINIIEGKSYDDIFETVQQQQENMAELDKKVDVTANTVVTLGAHVIEQGKDISKVQTELDTLDERVDNVEDDIGETKIKVEEIDNKTMTNAPKWSRDLTKLMNPKSENDWRLLAKRLSYSNDDIRGWAQQHDPCMAVLSEWYATHKTSEANHAILTALQEMNRLDGVAIMENAMKASEGVVEDEDFEYPSPPPIFLSYQWGVQNEVKLLKQHLNMAGYECWMDIGQMGGGDKLFSKIDNGIRAAKIVICCTTEKYAQSPNCNREVNLSVNLGKPIIPLLMEKMDWPPKGAMGPIFSEYLFIRFFQRGGEETKDEDQRYWPVPKFQELLMQLNFFVVPDKNLVKKEYEKWWSPIVEEIVIDKKKNSKSKAGPQKSNTQVETNPNVSPVIFLSYQWGRQPQIKALYTRLTSMGYTVWMDIYQMGGGDSLYDKIDRGLRGCKTVVSCITPKYALSANCRREVSLADALKKPIVPLLLEQTKWPPEGPMGPVFTELLYINMFKDPQIQTTWKGDKFDELIAQIQNNVPSDATNTPSGAKPDAKPKAETKSTADKSNKQTTNASNGKQTDKPKETGKGTQNSQVDKSTPSNKKSVEPKAQPSTEKAVSKSTPTAAKSEEPKAQPSTEKAVSKSTPTAARGNSAPASSQPSKSKSCILL